MDILEHYIIDYEVQQISTPKNKVPIINLKAIILHYTASTGLASTINYLQNPKTQASAHLVIGRQGEIIQLIPFNIQAWHAGYSEYKGLIGLNKYSIGIELINAGQLTFSNNNFYTYYGEKIPANQVYSCKEENQEITFWHTYPEKQIRSLIHVCKLLKSEYPQIKGIIGHSDITTRKVDPGKAFPWQLLLNSINIDIKT